MPNLHPGESALIYINNDWSIERDQQTSPPGNVLVEPSYKM